MKNAKILMPAAALIQVFLSACGRSGENSRPVSLPDAPALSESAEPGKSEGAGSSRKAFVPPNKLVPFESFTEKSPDKNEFFKSTAPAVYGIPVSSMSINAPGEADAATTTVISLPPVFTRTAATQTITQIPVSTQTEKKP
ncbi:MAG: hypothetical protein COT17_06850 [Elusimicrobia bacterium CG08_land_8_20_14_0_20_51_18]|nr:MAG: hypothetical protein COT17_06850 [Elusimicrobia bacterium CG08_land_8_20_14_0_20_51_18]